MKTTLDAFVLARLNRTNRVKTFDWDKAARLILEHKPKTVEAWLEDDYGFTADTIYENGQPVLDHAAYLTSNWATPVMEINGELIECWVYEDELPEDKQGHSWTESALAILKEEQG